MMRIMISVLGASLLYSSLYAAPIAKESGFSGYVSVGVTGLSFKSNMIAGNVLDEKISDERITTLGSSTSSEETVIPSVDYNVRYTFAEAQTEIFLGTELEDLLTFDSSSKLGVRKNFDGVGIVGASVLFSTLPVNVWKDPYDTTDPRQTADQTSAGLAIEWENIAESNFGLEMRARKYEIDGGDGSGLNGPYTGAVAHGLADSELNDQLNREGDMRMIALNYDWKINNKNLLQSSLRYSDYDLDGSAMQYKRTALRLNYLYNGDQWSFLVNAGVGKDDYDTKNPLFAKEADSTILGGSLTVGYKDPFGWSKDLSILGTVGAFENNSEIDFYDTSISMVNVGMLYRF